MTLYARVTPAWFWLGWIGLGAVARHARPRRRLARRGLAGIRDVCGVHARSLLVVRSGDRGVCRTAAGELARDHAARAPLLQPQFVVFALARHLAMRCGRSAAARALVGAGAYVGSEWLIPKLLGDTIGHGFLPAPAMRQAADLVGAPGLTVVLLLSNEATLAGCERGGRAIAAARCAPRAWWRGLAVLLLGYGSWRLRALAAATGAAPPLTVASYRAGSRTTRGSRRRTGPSRPPGAS